MTLLVAPITVENVPAALARAQLAKELGADAVEYRVDRLADEIEQVKSLVAQSPLRCIVTCRHACETGGFDGPEGQRIKLYEAICALPKPPLAVDVELVKWRAEPKWAKVLGSWLDAPEDRKPGRPKLILSSHDFNGRPEDLADRLAQMLAEPLCGVPKLAWKAKGLEDCALAMRLLKSSPRPAVALAMGEAGMPSRILAKKGGAFMTFAALDKASGTAPGQPLLSEMKNLYRWDDIKPTTKVYGVIGCPVGHSMSPAIHNAGFKEVGFDGVYVPMRIEEGYESFSCALDAWVGCKEMDFCGASVTIPHKENLLWWVGEEGGDIEFLEVKIGAANTLKVNAISRHVAALNTDYAAILESVAAVTGHVLLGFGELRVAVVGAGGAARAAVAAFASSGAQVSIFNRTPERGTALANDFGAKSESMDSLAAMKFDILINCTPLGMWPNNLDFSPLSDNHPALAPGVVVFDTVYNPIETKLLKQAKAAGCICIPGTEMFVRQAAAQFSAWTGKDAPLEVFRRILAEKLGK